MTMQALLRDKGVRWIGAGWTAFLAENLILSHNRDAIIDKVGDKNYHRLYNTLSTCACASILYGYIRHGKGKGPILWNPNRPERQAAAFVLQSLGLIGFSQLLPKFQIPVRVGSVPGQDAEPNEVSGSATPHAAPIVQVRCPMDFTPSDVSSDGVYGMKRVTRHPTFWSLGLLGLGTALSTPFAPEIVMFSAPAVFALIGGSHQDYRYRRGSGGHLSADVDSKTSGVPFLALLTGRQSWLALLDETKKLNAVVAILAALLLHRRRVRLAALKI